jgi:hypothetical protein
MRIMAFLNRKRHFKDGFYMLFLIVYSAFSKRFC